MDDAIALAGHFDATHTGFNYVLTRKLARRSTKARTVLQDEMDRSKGRRPGHGRLRRRRLVVGVLCFMLLLPIVLAPTHPIAVYRYLADQYVSRLTPKAFAANDSRFSSFLISPAQVERYRQDLLDDMMDTRSGKLFAIVIHRDGTFAHEPIRTWNDFVRIPLPSSFEAWLDRKELSFLGDHVDLWLKGKEIVAMGHYHAFGGGPSSGDRAAARFSELPEIVVSNGVVPILYLDGKLVPYGENVVIPQALFRHLRTLERSVNMDVQDNVTFANEASEGMISYLAYLRDNYNADITRRDSVATHSYHLCLEFRDRYRNVFPDGFTALPYRDNPDKTNLINRIAALQGWADIYARLPNKDMAHR